MPLRSEEYDRSVVRDFLRDLVIEPTVGNVDQMMVFVEAMQIFAQRNAKYNDLWKEYGLEDNRHHVKSKALRVSVVEDPVDDALDGINYNAFVVRLARGEDARPSS